MSDLLHNSREALRRERERIRSEMGGVERIEAVKAAGQQTIRENIAALVDEGSFEEIGTFATSDVAAERATTPGDGKIGGHATVNGRPVTVAGDDITVKRGSSSAVGGAKLARLYEQAEANGNPFVYFGATGGARIPDSLGSEGLARIPPPLFLARRQRRVPVATIISGDSFGGSSFISALSDLVIQIDGTCLAVTSPSVIETATGARVDAAELGGPSLHAEQTGQIDLMSDSVAEACETVRRFLDYLPSNAWSGGAPRGPRSPLEPDPELLRLVPGERRRAYDMRRVIRRLIDDGTWLELRPRFGRSILTGLGRVDGHSVGLIASQPMYQAGVLTPDACDKATRMICLCDAFDIPIVFLQDCPGFFVGKDVERARLLHKAVLLLQAVSQARTPKLTVVIRKAFGLAYYTLGGNDMGTDLLCCWPTAEISLMDPDVGAGVINSRDLEKLPPDARRHEAARLAEGMRGDSGPAGAAQIMKVDEIIDPAETRPVLGRALARLKGRAPVSAAGKPLSFWPTCW